ncbi:prepilin-type N-terminal cleavage/methylation domain-containing protein [Deinococcus sp. QL22]|uniref:type IV pilus modification PilV family protein n=1 Tax=Deinococcus sp. QL22 TaxID=2939437 RepID=UPI00201823B2|nr:prepilin-type N-terminal cleavage/methylation domain-containing protein [Deinococcus sp. QL22]UQN09990.1 prepilin-type N-terminal cleavage/methylation domain-containing protein [Deinococcus sp. QL22]
MRQQAGFSLIEVLVALVVTMVTVTSVSSLMLSSIRADSQSRSRTSVNTVVESWLDRYRSNQEPYTAAGTVCTGDSVRFSCTYPKGHDYATDGIYSHSVNATELKTRLGNYKTTITGEMLQNGANVDLWRLKVRVEDETRKQAVEANTHVIW